MKQLMPFMVFISTFLLSFTASADIVEVRSTGDDTVSTGTGTVIKKNLVITNYHVIENMNNIYIRYGDIKRKAVVVRIDIENDLALLKSNTGKLKPVQLSDKFSGYGVGYGYLDGVRHKSSEGQYTVQGTRVIYTSTLYKGLSGGPIYDGRSKRTVAIISAIARDSESCSDIVSIGIPARIVIDFINNKKPTSPVNSKGPLSLDMTKSLPIFVK